jgi:hypothetical protein
MSTEVLESEEFAMSSMIFTREQEKDKYLINVMMHSKQFKYVTIEEA